MSIFAKIASDPAMKSQLRAAKEKPMEVRERPKVFDGPDGNYVAKFLGQSTSEKNGNTLAFFEFVIASGDYDGQHISRMFWFSGTEPNDISMENLINTCRILGVDTDADIDPQLDKIVRAGTLYDIGIVTKADKKDPEKKYRTPYVNRVADVPIPEEGGEWSEVTEEPVPRSEPSLNGTTVTCGDDRCFVLSHNMESNQLVLVNPDDHDEVWYEDAKVADVTPI